MLQFLESQPVLKVYLDNMTLSQCTEADAWKDTYHFSHAALANVGIKPLWNEPLQQIRPAVFSPDGKHSLPCKGRELGRIKYYRMLKTSSCVDFCCHG